MILPDFPILWTGQTSCHDTAGRTMDCAGSGQDAAHRTGRPWPDPRFHRNGPLVTDHLTGLQWTADANPAEFPMTWTEAKARVAQWNANELHGFADWRLPDRRELRSLVDHQAARPTLPTGHPFDNLVRHWYWTATPAAPAPGHAWYLHMDGGRMFYGALGEDHLVWPVRGAHNAGWRVSSWDGAARFEIRDDQVLDRATDRLWTRRADLGDGPRTWPEALGIVAAMNDGDGGDRPWRLPTINELESLVDCAMAWPALPRAHPFAEVGEAHWSSTTSLYDPDWAWALYMGKGAVGVGRKEGRHFHVWAVR